MRVSETRVRRDSRLFEELCSALLRRGNAVQFRAHGQSMSPNLQDGDNVVVAPVNQTELRPGDVVLAENTDGLRVHRFHSVEKVSGQAVLCSDTAHEFDPPSRVYGKVVARHNTEGLENFNSFQTRVVHPLRITARRGFAAAKNQLRRAGIILSAVFAFSVCASLLAPSAAAQSLTITNTPSVTTVQPGGTITYTQVVANPSFTAVTRPLTLTQPLPANTTLVSATKTSGTGNWTCTPGTTITCSLNAGSTFNGGSSTTFTVVVTVNAGTANGTQIVDTATADGNNTTPVSASATTTLQVPDLALTQTVAPSVVAPGTNYVYSEVVRSNGPTSTNTGTITLSTQTPANATYRSVAGTNWACTTPAVGGTGNITCTYNAALAANATASTLSITMQVAAGTASGTVIQNSATVSDTLFTDPNPANNTSTSSITVEPSGTADLALTEDSTLTAVAPNTNYSYTETVVDNGPTATTTGTISVSTQTPANTTFQSYSGTSWTCTTPAVGATGNIVCTYNAALAVGATANVLTITLQVNTGTTIGTVITHSATVSNSVLSDPITSNNTSSTSITVATAGTADLQLTQVASTTALAAGGTYSYTETVVDNGPAAAASGTVTVYLQTPLGTNFQSYSGTNWSCTTPAVGATGPIICTYNTALASGATASAITISFQVSIWAANTAYTVGSRIVDSNGNIEQVFSVTGTGTSGATQPTWSTTLGAQTTDNAGGNQIVWQNAGTAAGTTIQSSATVTNSTLVDPVPSNNTSVTSVLIEPTTGSDLALSMSVFPTPVFISSNLTYTIQIQNLGQLSAPATSNVFTDTLPTGATFVSVTQTSGLTCAANGGGTSVSCSITTPMAIGTTATIAITITAPATASTLTNTATVSLSGDPNSSNNSATSYTVVQPLVCATPGKDGLGGSLTGTVNTYFPPASGTLAAGSTQVILGAASGASTPIAIGDLLLIIQMQGASINSTNTSSYGHGVPGDPASGYTSLGSSGLFEFVTATTAVATSGGTLKFTGSGTGGGLLNSYVQAAYSTTQGQETYQVIRVPQYTTATLSNGLTLLSWTGSVGGVLAIDVASQLTLGGTVKADAAGFRGGGGRILGGGSGSNTDYVTLATNNANGSKGEGIAGTPRYLAPATIALATTATDTGVEGLPSGSYARGAPGNAGGGGTDGDPAANDYNSGGGAGANGGVGGLGGYGWNSFTELNSTDGGFGGAAFPSSTNALIMGGAGGAGTTNNGSYYTSSGDNANCGANCTGIYSSGGAGGGIVIVHTGSVSSSSSGTITANGQSTLSTDNDSTGGGGAGGSILFFANSGSISGLTAVANGGSAGNAWPQTAPGGFPGQRHGPGGGGGGGVVFLSGSASTSVAAGSNGFTNTVQDSYGATPGQPGVVVTTDIITETPGTQPGAYCASADLSVTNSATPVVVAAGGNITYTQTVTNNGPLDAVNAVFSEGIPANTTFQSINTVPGWTCTTPAVGGTGTVTCTNPDVANAAIATFSVVVQVGNGTSAGTQIVDVDNVTSGTSDPNLANNTATAITTVGSATQADLAVVNTPSSPTVIAGNNFTMTAVVTNNGPAAATGAVFTESTASNAAATVNATFVSLAPPAGWTCTTPAVSAIGTITCTATSAVAAGATASFPIVMKAPTTAPSGTILSGTANIASPTPDPNTGNNSSTASVTVATGSQADLAVASTGTPNPVTPGNNITYAQTVTNNGPSAITASATTTVTFTDTIPAGTALSSAFVAPAGWTCNTITPIPTGTGTGTLLCSLNTGQTLAVGAVVNFPLTVQVNTTTAPGTTITNTPAVISSVGDPNTANNTATVTTLVVSPTSADVSINKTASPEPVNQGTNLAYTLTVKNSGPAIAQNVVVSDPIPAQVTYTSSFTTAGSCAYATATTTVTCSLGSLSVGSTAVITINVTAQTFSSSSLSTNTATVSSSTTDPNSSNNTSSAISTIQAATAVDISSFNAYAQQDGTVRLVWHTHEESRNLGFHVYREDGLGRHRVDPALIAGSALLLRGSKPQHAAKTYAAIDAQPSPNAAYWLEDLDINGTRTLHGPVYAEIVTTEQAQTESYAKNVSGLAVSPSLTKLYANARGTAQSGSLHPLFPIHSPKPVRTGPPTVSSFNPADHPGVKISVSQTGWYHIPFSQLFASGLNSYTDVRTLHLYAEGVEQPLLLTGHAYGIASPGDAIEFYGTGIDTPFSAERVYWLTPESSSGKRILSSEGEPSGAAGPASFPYTVVREDRTVYFAALLNGENNDNFFGAVLTSDPTDQTLNIVHRDTTSSQSMNLQLTLQGAVDGQQHAVSVQFNGASVGTMDFYGLALSTQSFPIDPSLAVEGTNTVTLTSLDGDNDVSAVQSIQVQYMHTFTADSDWLQATASSGSDVHISGFANSQVRVFDVTDPLNIFELNTKTTLDASSYSATAALPNSPNGERNILAFAADTLSAPDAIAAHTPTMLDEQRQGADIVIIAYPDFASHLAPLVQLRQSQGHKVSLVTTDQIYDDYNFGERSPFAIRSFLQDATTHWQRKPQAVLFVGDASMDPRNYLGFGDFDFVPTRIIETAALKTASDDWFTDFPQTGYATLPTGRLPARTAADVDLMVSKIVNYEQGTEAGPWNGQALVIADQNVDSNFTSAATSAAGTLPSTLQTSQILANGADTDTVHSQILSALNNGALLVNYNGHGAEQQWSFANIFDNNDATALANGGRLPVYLLIDCLNGLFQDVYAQSLSKALILAPNGGAVAVWASSGFTDQPPQASMNLALLQQLSTNPNASLGLMILRAKNVTTDNDVRRTWILLGDPSMKFHFAPHSNSVPVSHPVPVPPGSRNYPAECGRMMSCPKEAPRP